jgi:hypothetical protein
MKTIAQMYAEAVKLLPAGSNGTPNASDASRARLETYFQFWTQWMVILDPLNNHGRWGLTGSGVFDRQGSLRSEVEKTEGVKLLKERLGVRQLRFGTFFKLRGILTDACLMAKDHPDVDVALCALMVLVQLELGADPDPEYGNFPQRESAITNYELNDADLSDNPIEAEIQLDVRHDPYEEFGTSEYHALRWFQKWEETINDPTQFEQAFPGMGHRQPNVARALRPVFEHLDPVVDGYVLELFLRWAKQLLRSPLAEHRLRPDPETSATKAA